MSASDYQIGGDHYRAEYQHWDWCIDIRLGYLESASTKYVTRWQGKNGVQDVEKAIHYLIKLKESHCQLDGFGIPRSKNRSMFVFTGHPNDFDRAMKATRRFCKANNLSDLESTFMEVVGSWTNEGDLSLAIGLATRILNELAIPAQEAAQGGKAGGAGVAPGKAATATGAAKTGAAGGVGGATTQPPASSASTGVEIRGGIEHPSPFGYEGDD